MGHRAYWQGISTDGLTYQNYKTPRGAFEVYFMGVRLYSKLLTNQWPNSSALAAKCARVYADYVNDEDISGYEFVFKTQADIEAEQEDARSRHGRARTAMGGQRMSNGLRPTSGGGRAATAGIYSNRRSAAGRSSRTMRNLDRGSSAGKSHRFQPTRRMGQSVSQPGIQSPYADANVAFPPGPGPHAATSDRGRNQ